MADEDFMRYLKRFFSEFMCLFIAVRASALCSFCSRLCAEFHDFIIKDWRNRRFRLMRGMVSRSLLRLKHGRKVVTSKFRRETAR